MSVGGRGLTVRPPEEDDDDLSSIRSSGERSSPVTGSVPFSEMYDSIRRFSNTVPVKRDARQLCGKGIKC